MEITKPLASGLGYGTATHFNCSFFSSSTVTMCQTIHSAILDSILLPYENVFPVNREHFLVYDIYIIFIGHPAIVLSHFLVKFHLSFAFWREMFVIEFTSTLQMSNRYTPKPLLDKIYLAGSKDWLFWLRSGAASISKHSWLFEKVLLGEQRPWLYSGIQILLFRRFGLTFCKQKLLGMSTQLTEKLYYP